MSYIKKDGKLSVETDVDNFEEMQKAFADGELDVVSKAIHKEGNGSSTQPVRGC